MSYTDKKKALILLADGFEEMEAIVPLDILTRAGVEVTTAAVHTRHVEFGKGDTVEARTITGKNGLKVIADCHCDSRYGWSSIFSGFEGAIKYFDALILPGGPGVDILVKDETAVGLTRESDEFHSRIVAAICAAPLVLKKARFFESYRPKRRITAFPSCREELPDAEYDKAVVRDDLLITARSAGAATEFALEIVAALFDREHADKIAKEIIL